MILQKQADKNHWHPEVGNKRRDEMGWEGKLKLGLSTGLSAFTWYQVDVLY